MSNLLLDITPPDFDSFACSKELEIRVCPEALLERTRRDHSSQSFAETTSVTVLAHLALLPILFKIAGNSDSFMSGWLGRFSDCQCTLIQILGPVPWDTVVNPLWINSSISWHKTSSRPAFIIRSNHFKPLCSRSIMLGYLEYRCRQHVPTRMM